MDRRCETNTVCSPGVSQQNPRNPRTEMTLFVRRLKRKVAGDHCLNFHVILMCRVKSHGLDENMGFAQGGAENGLNFDKVHR